MDETERCALVTFKGSKKQYAYRTTIQDLVEGDEVVVESARGNQYAVFVNYIKMIDIATRHILYRRALNVDSYQHLDDMKAGR